MKNNSFSKEILVVKAAVLIVALIAVSFIAAVYLYTHGGARTGSQTHPVVSSTTSTLDKNASSTEIDDLYQGIHDVQFVSFAHTVIESRCPFYEPNGVVYHGCISDWVSQVEASSTVEAVDEVHGFCETFSNTYKDVISFKSDELFVKCTIWKLLQ
jgi:hypothetical protein